MSYPPQPNDAGSPNDNPRGQQQGQPSATNAPQGVNPVDQPQFGGSPSGFGPPPGQQSRRQFTFTRLGLLGVVGACIFGYMTYQSYTLASKSKRTPTTMTLSQLMAEGPGDNLYLDLTDVVIAGQSSVVEYKEGDEDSWTKIWIAAVPVSQEVGMPGVIPVGGRNVIVVFDDIHNEMDFAQRSLDLKHTGMVVNDIRNLGKEEADLLQQQIPGFDPETSLIFEVGSEPATTGRILMFIGLSAVCLVAGLFFFFPKV